MSTHNPFGVPPPIQAEAIMQNAARPTVTILLEGNSDKKFWKSRIDAKVCTLRVCNGWESVITEIKKSGELVHIIAILDADFDRLLTRFPRDPHPRIFWTTHNDLEGMLFASAALHKVCCEIENENKKLDASQVRSEAYRKAKALGQVRIHNERAGWGLTFKKQRDDGFEYLSEKEDFAGEIEKILKKAIEFSQKQALLKDVAKHTQTIKSAASQNNTATTQPEMDDARWCNGHDLIAIFSHQIKAAKLPKYSVEDLEERLRLAFEREHLHTTDLYTCLSDWEKTNAPLRIFPIAPPRSPP